MTSSETLDPGGRRVVLDVAGWRHIVDERRELAPHRDAVLATVAAPDHRAPDPRRVVSATGAADWAPSRWLMVVVNFGAVPARVVTAYGNRKDPPGWTS